MSRRLVDVATAIRSKNAGLFRVTCDVMFDDAETYRKVRDSGAITAEVVAELYRIPLDHVVSVVAHDPGQGIKVTIRRRVISGNPGDPDILGCQQHAPLYGIMVPA
jgi:hypothetical protein